MKRRTVKITSLLMILVMLLSSVSLTSCAYDELLEIYGVDDIDGLAGEGSDVTEGVSEDTEAQDVTEGGAEKDVQAGNSVTNKIIIEGNSDNVAYAATAGLRSTVSVYCTFSSTSGGNSPWNPRPSTQTYYTTGSGVIYLLEDDGSAFIVTNHHVVYDSSSNTENGISDTIYVYLYGLESEAYAIDATYVGGSANYDIAVLRVDKSEILKKAIASGSAAAVTVGDSDSVIPGDTSIAIGNPSATDVSGISVTKGIVSVESEYITMTASDDSGEVSFRVIRTDTPVNSGNSGGGLFNDKGELIGIVNAKISSSSVENIGYAIPSNVVRAIADNIIDYCYGTECETVMRGLLGITITVSGYSTAYDSEKGILERFETISVYEVTSGGLGESILKTDDIIKNITINDKKVDINRQHHLIDAMLDVRVGDTVAMVIERNGEEMTVKTTITQECLAAY